MQQATNDNASVRQLLQVFEIFGMFDSEQLTRDLNGKTAESSAAGDDALASELDTQIVDASLLVVNRADESEVRDDAP